MYVMKNDDDRALDPGDRLPPIGASSLNRNLARDRLKKGLRDDTPRQLCVLCCLFGCTVRMLTPLLCNIAKRNDDRGFVPDSSARDRRGRSIGASYLNTESILEYLYLYSTQGVV